MNECLKVPGYDAVRRDRHNKGEGGVLIYFKEGLNVHSETSLMEDHMEAVRINVKTRSQSVLVGCIYRPPTDVQFYNTPRETLSKVWAKRKNLLLVGDVNADFTARAENVESSQRGKRLKRILSSFGYKNVLKESTRVTEYSKSLIDLVITNQPNKIKISGAIDLGISDHHIIYAVFKLRLGSPKPKFITVRDYRETNMKDLKNDIERAPWQIVNVFDDVDDSVYAWTFLYNEIVQQHIKKRKVKIRQRSLPWIDGKLRKEMNRRYKLLKEAQQFPGDEQNGLSIGGK